MVGPRRKESVARPACSSASRYSSNSTLRPATTAARVARGPAQQRRHVLPHGRQAARLDEDDGVAARRRLVERVHRGAGHLAGVFEQALRDQRTAAAPVWHEAGTDARAIEHLERRDADLRARVFRERVREEHRADRRSRPRVAQLARQRSPRDQRGGVRRRSMPATLSDTARPSVLPERALAIGASRLPQRATSAHMSEGAHARGRPMALPLICQQLALDPGHVHARPGIRSCTRGTRGTGPARRARPGSSNPAGPSWPLSASRNTLARPRVECDSSRVAMYEGHIVPSRVLRHAPTPLHVSTARPRPPSAPKSKYVTGSGVR